MDRAMPHLSIAQDSYQAEDGIRTPAEDID